MTLAPSAVVREPTLTVLARPQFSEPPHRAVRSLGDATDGERLAEYAGRLQLASTHNPADRTSQEFLENMRRQGHESVFRHATYSVLIEGISAALGGPLERLPGFRCTARVQRYVELSEIRFVLPPAIIGDADLEGKWTATVAASLQGYRELTESLLTRFGWVADTRQRRQLAREAAASVLPQSTETALVATANVDAWRHLIAAYGAEQGELEGRRMAVAALRVLHHETPVCFSDYAIRQASDRRESVQVQSHKV